MNRKLAAQRVARRHKVASFNSEVSNALKKNKKQISALRGAIREVGMAEVLRHSKNPNVQKSKREILKGLSSFRSRDQFNKVLEVFRRREEIARELLSSSPSSKKASILVTLGAPMWLVKAVAWLVSTNLGFVVFMIGCFCILSMGAILAIMIGETISYSFSVFLDFVFVKFPSFIFKAVLSPFKFMYELASKFDKKMEEEDSAMYIENPSDREEVDKFRRSR